MDKKGTARQPRGKEEVRSALLAAADALLGGKGPDSVSVRDVSTSAGVNHALIHRHFGSKDALLRDVLAEHARAFRQSATDHPDRPAEAMFDVVIGRPAFVRIMAQLILSGHAPEEYVFRDGGIAKLAGILQQNGAADNDLRMRAAVLSSLSLGWSLFEPFLLYAVGLEGHENQARAMVRATLAELVASSAES